MPNSRATWAMTSWSTNRQPSRSARRAAISPPPLPYSRETVMARISSGAAPCCSPISLPVLRYSRDGYEPPSRQERQGAAKEDEGLTIFNLQSLILVSWRPLGALGG